MAGLTIKIDAADLGKTFGAIAANLEDLTTAHRQAGGILRESIRYNFAVGGRPDKWVASKRSKDQGIGDSEGQPLRDTGRLMNSWTRGGDGGANVDTPSGIILGSNVIYAAVMNFGATKGSFGEFTFTVGAHERTRNDKKYNVKAHKRTVKLPWGDIPARNFAVIQTEDVEDIRDVYEAQITRGT